MTHFYLLDNNTGFSIGQATNLTSRRKIVPARPYQEYNDDDHINTYFTAHNALMQIRFDLLDNTPLSDYTNPLVCGSLLDWLAEGVYGIARPQISNYHVRVIGPCNTYGLNYLPAMAKEYTLDEGSSYTASDDIYKRVITWHAYDGDGRTFSFTWLKRRLVRFLNGAWGKDYPVDDLTSVSVNFTANRVITITLPTVAQNHVSAILADCIVSSVVELPLNFTWKVAYGVTNPDLQLFLLSEEIVKGKLKGENTTNLKAE
jgi:hypothetical protein